MNLFCFGFGQVARNFIKKLDNKNINYVLNTTNREETKYIDTNNKKFLSYKLNEDGYDENIKEILNKADHALISIPPIQNDDLVLKNLIKFMNKDRVKWITYLSATSVYGNHNGEWVDENTKCIPSSSNGIARLKVENSWLDLFKKFNYPIQIFRLSGIYSDKNNVLKRLKTGEAKLIFKENHFFSRIHVDDISNILFKSLKTFKSGEIFNISDDKPAPLSEVTLYGAKLLNIKKLKELKVEEIDSEMLKNFFKDSKKVQNKKMKKFFDYNLKYPSFTEGLDYIRNNFV
ncbi:MAG: oxidoreductase [Candidatus Pelagibacter sp. TMED166]|nr:MAG: oxidoreductase [Candidatus Pelagibacter sp. TMED166]|tara:strand:- start:14604 stop:15470 length:867 start_codon:yes stop_codon:yes gene_type:complete